MILNKNVPLGSSVGSIYLKTEEKWRQEIKYKEKEDEWDVRICTYALPTSIKS